MNAQSDQALLSWISSRQSWMLEQTQQLAQINSGTFNAQGVSQVAQALVEIARPLNAQVEKIALPAFRTVNLNGEREERELGPALSLIKRPDSPRQILLCGHLDTVFADNDPFQQTRWLDDERLNGPGLTDMKGGLLILLTALMALEQHPEAEQLGWRVIMNPDEEIGSPCSADLLREAAETAKLGLVFEPLLPDGAYAGERKGSGNFTLIVRGRTAHAGREIENGRNALRALCDLIIELDNLNGRRQGVSINPARFHTDVPLNRVPDLAVAQFNIRTQSHDDEHWLHQQLSRLALGLNGREGYSLEIEGSFSRHPKRLTPANQALFKLLCHCASTLDIPTQIKPTGGCCDGNNLAAAGLPNIDTLGAEGGSIHSADEFLIVSSLSRRAQLTASFLLAVARGELDSVLWPHLNGG
ncbi:MAG: acetylornithine deacetylase [Oceanospirillaceae bacterium]|nr:acetylornithine deacetylase [Oceanospirillaceae bacterium]